VNGLTNQGIAQFNSLLQIITTQVSMLLQALFSHQLKNKFSLLYVQSFLKVFYRLVVLVMLAC
jgi:hypothetical protein